jgi:hypothetical protein
MSARRILSVLSVTAVSWSFSEPDGQRFGNAEPTTCGHSSVTSTGVCLALGCANPFWGIDCDTLSIHESPDAYAGRCGAERATNRRLSAVDVFEQMRGHGSDFKGFRRRRLVRLVFENPGTVPLAIGSHQSVLTRYKTTPCGGTTALMSRSVFLLLPVHRSCVE